MKSADQLSGTLRSIDGKGYGAYKSILGAYDFGDFDLHIDYVQGDPFATPSRLRALLPASVVQLPEGVVGPRIRRTAAADYLNRKIVAALAAASRPRGSGVSGSIEILQPGQQILERTSLQISQTGDLVVRLTAGLPARGRRVMGRAASEMLTEDIPRAIRASLLAAAIDDHSRAGPLDLERGLALVHPDEDVHHRIPPAGDSLGPRCPAPGKLRLGGLCRLQNGRIDMTLGGENPKQENESNRRMDP